MHGERLPFHHVLGRVTPHGMGLALGAIGFGTIATFITLYYASRGWANAVLCLSAFGGCFIGARLLREHMTRSQIVGATIMLTGVLGLAGA